MFLTLLAKASVDDGKIPIGKGGVENINKIGAQTLTTGILNAVYLWAGIVCVLIIVIGGLIYATSSGDAAGVQRGKNAILAAIVGLVIITMAFTLTNFIIGKF